MGNRCYKQLSVPADKHSASPFARSAQARIFIPHPLRPGPRAHRHQHMFNNEGRPPEEGHQLGLGFCCEGGASDHQGPVAPAGAFRPPGRRVAAVAAATGGANVHDRVVALMTMRLRSCTHKV